MPAGEALLTDVRMCGADLLPALSAPLPSLRSLVCLPLPFRTEAHAALTSVAPLSQLAHVEVMCCIFERDAAALPLAPLLATLPALCSPTYLSQRVPLALWAGLAAAAAASTSLTKLYFSDLAHSRGSFLGGTDSPLPLVCLAACAGLQSLRLRGVWFGTAGLAQLTALTELRVQHEQLGGGGKAWLPVRACPWAGQ